MPREIAGQPRVVLAVIVRRAAGAPLGEADVLLAPIGLVAPLIVVAGLATPTLKKSG